jgi:hypothetical protein
VLKIGIVALALFSARAGMAGVCADPDTGYQSKFERSVANLRWSLSAVSRMPAKDRPSSDVLARIVDSSVISLANTLSVWGHYAQKCDLDDVEYIDELKPHEKFSGIFVEITSSHKFPVEMGPQLALLDDARAVLVANKEVLPLDPAIVYRLASWKKAASERRSDCYLIAAASLLGHLEPIDPRKIKITSVVRLNPENKFATLGLYESDFLASNKKTSDLFEIFQTYYAIPYVTSSPAASLPEGVFPK